MAKQPPVLTEQELEIMKVVWDRESVTVRDVYETLRAQRQIAYTTVMTMMRILERKGHVKVSRADRAFVYRPARARQRVLGEMVREFVDRVFGGAAEPLVQHLVRDRHLTEDDLKDIAAHLKRRKREDEPRAARGDGAPQASGEERGKGPPRLRKRMPMTAEWLAGNIAAHWIQAGVLALSALIAIRLLNLNEPRARLAALHVTLVAIVLLPLVQPWTTIEPALEVTSSTVVSSAAPVYTLEAAQAGIEATSWPDPSLAIVAIVMAGVGMRLLWLFYGIIRLSRFSGQTPAALPPAVAEDFEAQLGVSARYIQQTGSRGPWTFGFLRPTIALPAGFDALLPAFQRAVICHELVHIKRRDIAVAFFEELALAALWFHPWMWLLRARIRVLREQVVDARVVTMLGNREDYVRCLVDLSGHDLAPHFSQAGAGMLRPRELRARVDAIFQEVHMSRMRFAVAASAFVAVTIATGLIAVAAMPLRAASLLSASNELPTLVSRFLISEGMGTAISWTAAAQPQAAQSQTIPDSPRRQINKVYPEYPQDAIERGIRGTVVVDITVNAAGEVTTAAVASGPQELRASAFIAALKLKYTPGGSTTAMRISFEYTLTGNAWGVRVEDVSASRGTITHPADIRNLAAQLASNPDATGAYRIGGGLMPPKKIKDMPPVYPPIAQQARVQGVVIMELKIDEHGNVSDTKVLRSIPLLDQAAIEAVKQWQYTPTLMNGVAVPIIMTVTVNFSLRPIVRIEVLLPDGKQGMVQGVSGTSMVIDAPGIGRYHMTPTRAEDPDAVNVSLFGEDGQTPLGEVTLKIDGPVVQTPTTPSLGLRLLMIR